MPVLLQAQSFTATVRGVVTDAARGAVPAAKVTLTDVQRNTVHRGETDSIGRYTIAAVPVGTYAMTVEATGFQKYTRSAFPLAVQEQATIDVELQVGQVTTSVEVTGAAPLLNITSANLGQVIDNRYIDQLPLINRNVFQLAMLTPGVVGAAGAYNAAESLNFSAVGTRNSTAEVLLDGVTITVPEHNAGITTPTHTPSVDAVQEFKVQTSYFSAEFGNTGGAVVNMVTKSGTNRFHGSGYWYYRDSVLNANSFFSNRSGAKRPSSHRHLYGGTFGGPVKKDRTFFFVSYERIPESSPRTAFLTLPTLQQRQGDFSDYKTTSGQQINIFNPRDNFTNAAGVVKRMPFPGNVIPRSMFDPIAVKAASYYPEPNQPNTFENNWFGQGLNHSVNWYMEIKGDHNFSEKDRISARYSPRRSVYDADNLFGEGHPGPPWELKHTIVGRDNAALDYTRVHSARTILNVRFGLLVPYYYSRTIVPFDLTTLGLPAYIKEAALEIFQPGTWFPQFQPAGYGSIGDAGWTYIGREDGARQVIGSVTRFVGGHNMKIGGEFRKNFLDYSQPGYPAGSFSFSRQITSEDLFASSSVQGNGFASMLLGWGSGSRFDHNPFAYTRSRFWAVYIQDDWKVSRKLTLNLGFRYEIDEPHWEKEYRESYWNLDDPSPLNGKVPGYDLRGFFEFTNEDNPSPFNKNWSTWQPRVGIAYAVDDKTSVRTGYGMYYTLARSAVNGALGAGFNSQSSVTWSLDSNETQYAYLNNPYPDGLTLPIGRSQGAMSYIGLGAGTIVRENIKPVYHSWNFSMQRQITGSTVVEVNYAGTKGSHQHVSLTNLSPLLPAYWGMGRTALNAMVANPFYGVITDPRSVLSRPTTQLNRLLRPMPQYSSASRSSSEPTGGNSIYNSLQLKLERRFSRGLSLLAHYTVSKAMDNFGNGTSNWNWLGGSSSLQDLYNLANERALSMSDIPQRLVVTFSYELPIGTGKLLGNSWGRLSNALLGGWQVSGYMTFQSGVPIAVTQSGGTLWDATQRPNLIGDPNPGGSVVDRLTKYFNEAAFSQPPSDVLGTAPRYLNYRAPGIRNGDITMFKNFVVKEGMRGEFRFEMQNFTNSPSFGFPSAAYGSTSFGQITGYKAGLGPRVSQIGLKFHF
jgi:hypothetical protein